jgi:hypothetical protein
LRFGTHAVQGARSYIYYSDLAPCTACVPGQARVLTCSSSSMFYKDGNSPQDNK